MGGACISYVGREIFIQRFCGESCGKKPLRRPRRKYEDNIKMDFQEVGRGIMVRINMSQIRYRWRHLRMR